MDEYAERTKRNLGILSDADQRKIRDLRVAIAGVGTEGSRVLELLARLGVNNFTIADPDVVELHNLNRQIYTLEDIGLQKVTAAARKIKMISKDISLVEFPAGVNSSNVERFTDNIDVVVDAIDITQTETSVLLGDTCKKKKITIFAGVTVAHGCLLYVFQPKGWSIRDLVERKKLSNWIPVFPKYIDTRIIKDVLSGKKPAPVVCDGASIMAGSLVSQIVVWWCNNIDPPFVPKVRWIDPVTATMEEVDLVAVN